MQDVHKIEQVFIPCDRPQINPLDFGALNSEGKTL